MEKTINGKLKEIREEISDRHVEKSLVLLISIAHIIDNDDSKGILTKAIMLRSRYNGLKTNLQKGILDLLYFEKEENGILTCGLQIISEIEKFKGIEHNPWYLKYLAQKISLWGVIPIILLYFLYLIFYNPGNIDKPTLGNLNNRDTTKTNIPYILTSDSIPISDYGVKGKVIEQPVFVGRKLGKYCIEFFIYTEKKEYDIELTKIRIYAEINQEIFIKIKQGVTIYTIGVISIPSNTKIKEKYIVMRSNNLTIL